MKFSRILYEKNSSVNPNGYPLTTLKWHVIVRIPNSLAASDCTVTHSLVASDCTDTHSLAASDCTDTHSLRASDCGYPLSGGK